MKTLATLFSLPMEAAPFLRRNHCRNIRPNLYEGHVGDKTLMIRISGTGPTRLERETESLLLYQPEALIIAGFAGALDHGLHAGDIIAADSVIDCTTGYSCDETLTKMAKKRLGDASVRQILTVDRVAHTPEEKKSIKSGHECCAVDMESAIAASVASRHGVPFVVIRSIVDDCNCAIPKVLADIVQEDGQPDIFALAQKAIKQPRLIVSAIDLGMRSRRAALSLSLFLTDYLQK